MQCFQSPSISHNIIHRIQNLEFVYDDRLNNDFDIAIMDGLCTLLESAMDSLYNAAGASTETLGSIDSPWIELITSPLIYKNEHRHGR